jgi:MinD-like ATPase involved in chromosome partitioning or flagellar assembly|tara:strand:- start:8853 stop:9314 length:462 start_codon:yes stop_codon:yes gene_type:complete
MPSIEYQGMKFTGGKFFLILSLIGAIIGGGWTGYKFYDDYLDMKAKIEEYTAPDLSSYDEQIAVIKSELDMILDEITLVADVAKDLKNDMKTDLRQMGNDIRHITEIVNDVEDRQKEDIREIFDEIKIIEDNLNLNIDKALNNPLNDMSAKAK